MLRFLVCFLILGATMALDAQPLEQPSLEEITKALFERYRVPSPAYNYLGIERRPEGYHVLLLSQGSEIKDRELFYDFSEKKYKELTLFGLRSAFLLPQQDNINMPLAIDDAAEMAQSFLQKISYKTGEFARQPFYGYRGWYKDVIKLYENKKNLSDWELNALGRAYQTNASALLDDNDMYTLEEERFNLPNGANAMSEEQVNQFLDLIKKELACYERLLKQNPAYMTPVGPVTTKHPHEVMSAFLQLLFFQNEETARRVLKKDIYDSYLLQSSKNILSSCPQDALLFVWGDGDTYPLYYLQAVEHFRTDVIVVNLSLIVLPRYLSMIVNGPFGAKPIKNRFPKRFFEEIVIINNFKSSGTKPPTMEADHFLEMFEDSTQYEQQNDYQFFKTTVDSVALSVPVGASKLPRHPLTKMYWQAPKNTYFYTQELLMIDVLVSNEWKRPLCFSLTCRPESWEAWGPYLAFEGLVYRVYPNDLNPNALIQPWAKYVNTEQSYRLWTEVFGFDTHHKITDFDKKPLHQITFLAGINLAKEFIKEGNIEKARDVATSLPLHLPNETAFWGSTWVDVVELLGECGAVDKAEEIAGVILNNFLSGLLENEAEVFVGSSKSRLLAFAEKYNKKALKERLGKF